MENIIVQEGGSIINVLMLSKEFMALVLSIDWSFRNEAKGKFCRWMLSS